MLLKIPEISQENTCVGASFFKPRPATLSKKRLWHICFPMNFTKFLRTPFFIEHFHCLLLLTSTRIQYWYSSCLLVASALSIFTPIPICCNYWQSLYHSLNFVSLPAQVCIKQLSLVEVEFSWHDSGFIEHNIQHVPMI